MPTQTAHTRALLAAGKPFTLPLTGVLPAGVYTVVMYDSSLVSAPYTYSSSGQAVAPVLDSVAHLEDFNMDFTVDASGKVTQNGAYDVLVSNFSNPICNGLGIVDPLMVNLGSGPIQFSSQANGVSIDLTGSGTAQQLSWPVAPSTAAFLVHDITGTGLIGPSEVFGNFTVGPDGQVAANGYDALRKYDSNGDGIIDSRDQ